VRKMVFIKLKAKVTYDPEAAAIYIELEGKEPNNSTLKLPQGDKGDIAWINVDFSKDKAIYGIELLLNPKSRLKLVLDECLKEAEEKWQTCEGLEILTEKEKKALDELLTCSKCGSKVVKIFLKERKCNGRVNIYVRRCEKCGYEEELKEVDVKNVIGIVEEAGEK